ncbi:MAG: choice-of-anchor D domain-containing protein, partial [Gemmatimonadota bacterium]
QVGKDGRFFLLNRDGLGGRSTSNNSRALSVTKAFNGEWGHPAVFADTPTLSSGTAAGANDFIYYIGKGDNLRFLKFGVNGSDKPTLHQIGNSTVSFGYSSGSPAVTSSGTDPASAVVWAVYTNNAAGGGATLEAFPGTPQAAGWPSGCTSGCAVHPLASWRIFTTAAKFTNVATSGNMVFVGTRSGATSSDGTVYGFGAPAAAAPVAPAPAATLGQAPVNATATKSVTLTATKTVTVTGVSAATGAVGSPPPPGTAAPAQFSVNTGKATSSAIRTSTPAPNASGSTPSPLGSAIPSPTSSQVRFPVTLHKGDKLTVPVTFSPSAPGGATGAVTFATSAGPQDVAVAAVGTTAGLYANQQNVQFALVNDIGQFESDVPAGVTVPREFNIVNGGTQPLKISSVNPPGGPYTVVSGPQPGDVLKPGESQVVQIEFTPAAPGSYPAAYSISGDDGTTATVKLTGTGLPPDALFKASPATLDFGPVKVGKTAHGVITLTNTGNEPATVVSTSPLAGPFTRTVHMPAQLPVNAGYDVRAPISFTPRHKGTFTTTYTFTWSDITGTHTLSVKITGKGV